MIINRTTATVKPPPAEDLIDDLSIVYPCTDDMPMADNDVQFIPVTDALAALRHQFSHRDDVYVSGNLFVYYRRNDNDTWVAPDVLVVMGGTRKGPRYSWITWREGKVPDFVMEVTSPSTWEHDALGKRRIYADMGVAEYWRFDPLARYLNPPLVGERLVDGEYRPIEVTTDADGILRGHSPVLGLDLCVLPGGLLRFYDPERGVWLHTYEEEVAIREAAERGKETAERAKEAAERGKEAAERGKETAERAQEAAEQGREAAERGKETAERAQEAAEQGREAAERAKETMERAKEAAKQALQDEAAARQAAEAALQQETATRQALEDEIRRLRQQLPPGE